VSKCFYLKTRIFEDKTNSVVAHAMVISAGWQRRGFVRIISLDTRGPESCECLYIILYYIFIIMVSYLALASYKHENGFSSFMRTLHRYRQTLLSEDRIVKISSEIRPILIVYIYYNTYASRAECKTVFYERSIFTPYCYSCAALYRYIVVLRYINRVRGYLGGVPGYKLPRSHQGRYIRNVFIVVSVG